MNLSDLQKGAPEIGDKLFVSGDTHYGYASINRGKGLNNEVSQFLIIEGYREAVLDILSNLLTDEQIDWLKIDSKVLPAIFLFRHYLEVILKDTLRYYNILNGNSYSDEVGYKKGHSLGEIWQDLKPFLEKDYQYYDDELKVQCKNTMQAVENIILEIDALDGSSFGFRYAFKTAKSINDTVEYSLPMLTIDLENLRNIIVKMMNYFEGINSHAAVLLDEKQTNYE